MKRVYCLLLVTGSLLSCHEDGVEASQEVNATIIGSVSAPYAGCSYSYALLLDDDAEFHFRYTKELPEAFSKAGTLVKITYRFDEACQNQQPRPTDIITITSIRNQ